MSSNEYIAGFFGIMIGLSITELLRGIYQTIINSKKVEYFLPHGIGIAALFMVIIIFFFDYYRVLHKTEVWTPLGLILHSFPLIVMFFLTMVVFPSFNEAKIDFKEHTFKIWPKIYMLGFILAILLIVRNMTMFKFDPFTIKHNISLLLQMPFYLIGWFYRKREWTYYLVNSILFILLLGSTMIFEI
jgi:hypothetical protein